MKYFTVSSPTDVRSMAVRVAGRDMNDVAGCDLHFMVGEFIAQPPGNDVRGVAGFAPGPGVGRSRSAFLVAHRHAAKHAGLLDLESGAGLHELGPRWHERRKGSPLGSWGISVSSG